MFVTRHTAEKVERINFQNGSHRDHATLAEIAQLCSVVGSVGWVARQSRPDLSDLVSRLQAAGSGQGMRYPSGQIRCADVSSVACSGANFVGEDAIVYG